MNSVVNITDENNSFSISTTGQWPSNGEETMSTLQTLLEPISQNDIELHSKERENKGALIKMNEKE